MVVGLTTEGTAGQLRSLSPRQDGSATYAAIPISTFCRGAEGCPGRSPDGDSFGVLAENPGRPQFAGRNPVEPASVSDPDPEGGETWSECLGGIDPANNPCRTPGRDDAIHDIARGVPGSCGPVLRTARCRGRIPGVGALPKRVGTVDRSVYKYCLAADGPEREPERAGVTGASAE